MSIRSKLPRARIAIVAILLAAVACLTLGVSQAGASNIYFAGTATKWIGKANANGKRIDKTFINTATRKTDTSIIALAANRKYIYWVTGDFVIGRAQTNGKRVQRNLVGNANALNVALDSNYLYWVTTQGGVGRANLDGSSSNPSFIPGTSAVNTAGAGIAIDQNYIYWSVNPGSNWGQSNASGLGSGTIARASVNGSAANSNFVTGTFGISGLAVNSSSLFAAVTLLAGGGSQVGSIGIGGGPVTGFMPTTLANPQQVEGIDLSGATIYLTDQGYQSAPGSIPPARIYGSLGSVKTNGTKKRDLIRRLSSAITSVAVS